MSPKLFEQFLRTEIARHPSLAAALKWKGGLRRCSQLFEEAVADLHYRLIRRAVQLLFSRVNATRLRQLNAGCQDSCCSCSGGGGDGGVGGGVSCETKYIGTDSSCTATPSKNNRDCSPISHCSSRSADVANNIENSNARWDRQSNNSQSLKQTPRSPARKGGCCGNSGSCGGVGGGSRWTKANEMRKLPQQQCQHQHQQPQPPCNNPQQQQQQQQNQQLPSCQPPEYKGPPCARAAPQSPKPPTQPPMQQNAASMASPQQQPTVREGPAYNYPTTGRHNRQAMAGWYVANMDALLSNLMRLFEKIYADTLRMCGTSPGAMRQMNNALPDPTLLSMQQRAGGAWRPNYMNCKIDFLLHIAAMVYRNTQDLRCGCQCPEPADPCSAWSEQPPVMPDPPFTQQQPHDYQQQQTAVIRRSHTENRNNAAAAAVVTADEFDDAEYNIDIDKRVGCCSCERQYLQSRQHHRCKTCTPSEESSWAPDLNSSNTIEQQRSRQRSREPPTKSQQQQSVMTVHKSRAFVASKDIRTNDSAISDVTALPSSSWASKPVSVWQKQHRQRRQRPPPKKKQQQQAVLTVQRSCAFVASEDAGTSSSDSSNSATSLLSSGSDTSSAVSADRAHFRLSVDVPQ